MVTSLPVLLLLLLGTTIEARRELSFGVRQMANEDSRLSALLYAGHPQRAVPLAIKWSLLAGTSSVVLDATHRAANQTDLPGRIPAIHLPGDDAIARGLARQHHLQFSSLGNNLVDDRLDMTRLEIDTLGQRRWLSVNAMANAEYAKVGTHHRGALYIGPGSVLFTQWRYATLGKSRLTLTDTFSPHPRAHFLPCMALDVANRCILDPFHSALTLVDTQGDAFVLGGLPDWKGKKVHVVLDWESSASVLPTTLSHNLVARSHWAELQWLGLRLARSSDLGGGHVFSSSGTSESGDALLLGPEFVVSAAENATLAANGGSIIVKLGRRTLTRLFGSVTYDSSVAGFYVVGTQPLPEAVEITLAILVTLQACLVASFLVSPFLLNLGQTLAASFHKPSYPIPLHYASEEEKAAATARARKARAELKRAEWFDSLFCFASLPVALTLFILGYQYAGQGSGVDVNVGTNLQIYSLFVLIIGCVSMTFWLILYFFPQRKKGLSEWRSLPIYDANTWADRVAYQTITHTIYAHTVALSIQAGLVPTAGLYMVHYVTLSLVGLVFVFPLLLYSGAGTLMVAAFRGVRSHYMMWSCLAAVACLVMAVPDVVFFHLYVLQPLYAQWDVSYTTSAEISLAWSTILLVCFIVLVLLFMEVYKSVSAAVARKMRRLEGDGKKRV
jgi:hypothetical protein